MKTGGRVFLVDDDELIVAMLARALKREGYEVCSTSDPTGVVEKIRAFSPNVVLLDIKLPGASGLDILAELAGPDVPWQIVMLTSDDTAETAVKAMKRGAADYVTKPFDLDEIKIVVKNAVERLELKQEVDYLRRISSELTDKPVIGETPAIGELKAQAVKLARAAVPVILITGESGTGKEVFSRYIHQIRFGEQPGRPAPFVGINCAALPEALIESELFGHEKGSFTDAKRDKKGVFELAAGGSILLDEIGEMKLALQSKLLRVLEERVVRRVGGHRDIAVDAAVFATTNRNLEEAVERGEFRQDLFFRLNAFALFVPPLRERKGDILPLATYFLRQFATKYKRMALQGFAPEAEQLLVAYDWPGNVRELRNVVERIVVLETGETVTVRHLPTELRGAEGPGQDDQLHRISLPDSGISLEELERSLIVQALEKSGGNKTRAAKLLNMTYDSLRYQIKKFGLD